MEQPLRRIKTEYFTDNLQKTNYPSLYDRIFADIKTLIERGELPFGSVMPSTRVLSAEFKISRSTVVQVYELLKLGKLIASIPGSGYKVIFKPVINTRKSIDIKHEILKYPPLSLAGESFSKSDQFLEKSADEEMAFRPGLPPLDIFPVNQWKILNNQYWRYVKDAELTYMASSGSQHLRESLATYLNFTRKIKCDPRQIIVVSGSLQSIYSISTILLNPGDPIVHENPTFPNVISMFKGLQCDVHAVPIDQEGISLDDLKSLSSKDIKIVHTVPSCHYPTGVRMSMQRRLDLLQWASENNAILIENDYEHEVNNYDDYMPSLYSLDKEDRTFFLGTFNRLLHPSIRVGYMVVPLHYLDAMESLLRHLHRFVPNSKQMVLSQFIDKNLIYKHIQKLISIAEERKEFFLQSFGEAFKVDIPITETSTRSLHVLAEFNSNDSDQKVIQAFRTNHIAVHAYSKTFVGKESKQGLILGYTPVKRTEMRLKIRKMLKVYQEFKKRH